MLKTTRRAGLPALAAAALLLASTPALAGDGWGKVDCTAHPDSSGCDVSVGVGGTRVTIGGAGDDEKTGAGAAGPSPSPCRWQRVAPQAPPPPGKDPGGSWYSRICTFTNGALGDRPVWFEAPPHAEVQTLAQHARSQLRLPAPAIHVNPAPPTPQIEFVPTWVWLNADSWGSRMATASVPGMSVTATATAKQLVLSTGDGGTEICRGVGTRWTSRADPAQASGTCGHTYTTVPSGGTYRLQATVTWTVTWAGGGVTGTVPAMTTTAAIDLPVERAGALNTSGRVAP
jgi:hypothetical protein